MCPIWMELDYGKFFYLIVDFTQSQNYQSNYKVCGRGGWVLHLEQNRYDPKSEGSSMLDNLDVFILL